MAKSKYERLIIRNPVEEEFAEAPVGAGKFAPIVSLYGEKFGDGANFSLFWRYIKEPWFMRDDPHAHDFEQFLCFLGGNPNDVGDFGAEVELSLGEEGEKLIIDTTSIVHIPKGLIHCPLNFKRIDKPIVFMDIFLASGYKMK